MTNYLKLALKVLARRKFFTFISLFGISLTLLVLMVAAALLDNEFAPRPPESRFNRVLCDYYLKMTGPDNTWIGLPGYKTLNRDLRGLTGTENVSIYTADVGTVLYEGGRRLEERLKRTDGHYWQILDFHFVEGSPFTSSDDANGNRVAVITSTVRSQLFGRAPALGRTIGIEGESYRIVGVVSPVSITRHTGYSDIWAPIGTIASSDYLHATFGNFEGIVLAKNRADFPRLKREFATRMAHFPLDDPKNYNRAFGGLDTPFEATARQVEGDTFSDKAAYLLAAIMGGAAILFMTLPALNLVTLNLSRILERAPEIGVRKAFGAPRRSLVGQFVLENVVLSLMGGLIGFVLSVIAIIVLNHAELIHGGQLDLNLRIFVWGMLIALFFGVFSGLYPAWKMARLQPVDALRGGAK